MAIHWKVLTLAAASVSVGLSALVFRLSEAPSYLSDRPETCVNCHVMRPQYATWKASSHRGSATCNDCHVPHDSVVRKYLFKASDGMRHAAMFTLHMEPQVIRIHEAGAKVVQENCLRCHGQRVDATPMGKLSFTTHDNPRPDSATPLFPAPFSGPGAPGRPMPHPDPGRSCIECHRETPHGRVDSLSSTPEARVQRLQPLGATLLKEHP